MSESGISKDTDPTIRGKRDKMDTQNNEQIVENKMGVMPVNKLVFNMSLPMMVSMLVQALYNIVDSIFVAKVSENALTAVSLAFPLQTLLIAVGAGTGVGLNALISKSLGEKADWESSVHSSSTTISSSRRFRWKRYCTLWEARGPK